MANKTLAIIMDPIADIQFNHDSSLAILLAAQARGWQPHYIEPKDLFWQNGEAYANNKTLVVENNPQDWYQFKQQQVTALKQFTVILMRKDPPFDMDYIMATYFLDHAAAAGGMVVNNPQALRDANEKFFTTHFPQCMPPTLISSSVKQLQQFQQQQQKVVFKPLHLMGGQGIFVAEQQQDCQDQLLTLTDQQHTPILAQRYLPEIKQGDKRILIVNGEVIPHTLARIPPADGFLGNLAAGGQATAGEFTDRDQWICQQIAPTLKQIGLMLVGVDIIGDYLTEINVTCPTCLVEFKQLFSVDVADYLLQHIEKMIK